MVQKYSFNYLSDLYLAFLPGVHGDTHNILSSIFFHATTSLLRDSDWSKVSELLWLMVDKNLLSLLKHYISLVLL